MATYLIDYENPTGHMFISIVESFRFSPCEGLSDYKKCDTFWNTVERPHCGLRAGFDKTEYCSCNRVVLFYSEHSPKANRDEIIAKCTEAFEYKPNGVVNGLDFQLVTYLGSLIWDDAGFFSDTQFYIVSSDNSFLSALYFWESNEKIRADKITFALLKNKEDIYRALLKNKPFQTHLEKYFNDVDSLKVLHEIIQKTVGSNEECKKLYRALKPLFVSRKKER
jgi:hypothetical protein